MRIALIIVLGVICLVDEVISGSASIPRAFAFEPRALVRVHNLQVSVDHSFLSAPAHVLVHNTSFSAGGAMTLEEATSLTLALFSPSELATLSGIAGEPTESAVRDIAEVLQPHFMQVIKGADTDLLFSTLASHPFLRDRLRAPLTNLTEESHIWGGLQPRIPFNEDAVRRHVTSRFSSASAPQEPVLFTIGLAGTSEAEIRDIARLVEEASASFRTIPSWHTYLIGYSIHTPHLLRTLRAVRNVPLGDHASVRLEYLDLLDPAGAARIVEEHPNLLFATGSLYLTRFFAEFSTRANFFSEDEAAPRQSHITSLYIKHAKIRRFMEAARQALPIGGLLVTEKPQYVDPADKWFVEFPGFRTERNRDGTPTGIYSRAERDPYSPFPRLP